MSVNRGIQELEFQLCQLLSYQDYANLVSEGLINLHRGFLFN
jgi:hypothetical protein